MNENQAPDSLEEVRNCLLEKWLISWFFHDLYQMVKGDNLKNTGDSGMDEFIWQRYCFNIPSLIDTRGLLTIFRDTWFYNCVWVLFLRNIISSFERWVKTKFLCWGTAAFGKVPTENIYLAMRVERMNFFIGFLFPLGRSGPHSNTMAFVGCDVW